MTLFDKFLSKMENVKIDRVSAVVDIAANLTPWIVGGACVLSGCYGVGAYLAVDFAKSLTDNLKKAELISDPVKDWYIAIGNELVEETDYTKNQNKKYGKISDENSILAIYKSIYEK